MENQSMAEITNQLLKDAIADAEAVRQTAIANAKIALEETFTPQIKSMLARRLKAESMEAEGAEKAKEEPFQDADPVGGNTPVDTSTIGTGDNKEPSPAAHDSSGIDQGGEGAGDSTADWYDDWSESDFDLDEVIKELEADVSTLSEEKDEEEEELDESASEEEEEMEEGWKEDGEEGEEVEKTPAASPAGMHKGAVPAQSSGIGKEAATSAEGPSDVNKFVTDPSVPKHEMHGADHEMGQGSGEDEELDLEAILRELEAQDQKDKEQRHQMASRMADLQKELAEYREVVKVLRGRMNEVNLLNAKLLFTNKLFRNSGLTNEQKVAIVENFDRATTVREVKIVYTTLVETLTTTAKTMKRPVKTAKVVAEGLASKATPSTAPKAEILEENSVAARLKQLAGIL